MTMDEATADKIMEAVQKYGRAERRHGQAGLLNGNDEWETTFRTVAELVYEQVIEWGPQ